jgi:hypothetical protein
MNPLVEVESPALARAEAPLDHGSGVARSVFRQERVRAGIRDARAIVDTYLLNWFLGSRNQKMFRRLADIPQL